MEMNKKKILLDKKDCLRALLTDTLSSDAPIIYSNDGFYINCHRALLTGNKNLDVIVRDLYSTIISPQETTKKFCASYPMAYKIMKNDIDFRNLSLIHPRSQYNFVEFYKHHSDLITYSCSHSQLSIRAPRKVGGSMYINDTDCENRYKEINIDTLESEIRLKNASSFFSYKGIRRLYKLYSSVQYLDFEKRFPSMWNIDVANCFDSIYTHSIAWAAKEKKFSQKNARPSEGLQAINKFDQLMQRCNSNETSGIPIGSEVSRIFAEMIFQDIDLKVVDALDKQHNLILDKDYVVLRYVDDFILFGKNETDLINIYQTISDCLYDYKFRLNKEKMLKSSRPFSTARSSIITGLNQVLRDFDSQIFESSNDENPFSQKVNITGIRYKNKTFKWFVNQVKSLITNQPEGYAYVSSYIISSLARKCSILIRTYETSEDTSTHDIKDVLIVLLRIAFFFYSVYPGIPSSQKLARTIWVIDQFFIEHEPDSLPEIRAEIMALIESISIEDVGSIETLNIVLASATFGENYLLPVSWFKRSIAHADKLNYFDIVSLLYYFQNHLRFKKLKDVFWSN